MLNYLVKATEALRRLRADKDGVVSFEYIIVAACVTAAVIAAFGTDGTGAIKNTLAGAISTITNTVNAAVGS